MLGRAAPVSCSTSWLGQFEVCNEPAKAAERSLWLRRGRARGQRCAAMHGPALPGSRRLAVLPLACSTVPLHSNRAVRAVLGKSAKRWRVSACFRALKCVTELALFGTESVVTSPARCVQSRLEPSELTRFVARCGAFPNKSTEVHMLTQPAAVHQYYLKESGSPSAVGLCSRLPP